MPGLFITATGTEIGKTYVTVGLLRAARRAGLAVAALKPVLTGFDDADAEASDAGLLLAALGRPVRAETVAQVSPWRFAAPLSPNMAAAAEGRRLDFSAVVETCAAAAQSDSLTLIEGIGGVMVPLDARRTVLDLIAALACPAILVSGTALGALSHCLTAYFVMAARGVTPALIVLNESASSTVPLQQTCETLAGFCQGSDIALLRREPSDESFDSLLARTRSITGLAPDPSPGARTAA